MAIKSVISIILIFLTIQLAINSIETHECSKNSTLDVKTYVIDLDKPARDHFKEVVHDFKDQIWYWFKSEKDRVNPIIFKLIEDLAAEIDVVHRFPYPFNEEFMGIKEMLTEYNATYGDIVIFNLIYDFTAFCTSIVTQQANGQIIHGRNFDYDFPSFLSKLTYKAQYVKNGTVLYTSIQPAGYVGVITGHRYNSFTFSMNERDQGEWYMNILTLLLDSKSMPVSFLTRELMENKTNYDEAVAFLSKSDLIAPVYFIVGGVQPYEGVVITRSQFETVDIWHLNSSSIGIEKWYLLETNYDHWVPPPANDDRRTPGMKYMNATGQANINYDALLNVLTLDPVCNKYKVLYFLKQDHKDKK